MNFVPTYLVISNAMNNPHMLSNQQKQLQGQNSWELQRNYFITFGLASQIERKSRMYQAIGCSNMNATASAYIHTQR